MRKAFVETALDKMLQVREERVAIQNSILKKYNSTIISFTMNIPGPIKNNDWIQQSFLYGKQDLLNVMGAFGIEQIESRRVDSGPEGYFVVQGKFSAEDIKKNIVEFEERHSIGRWFDIDVKNASGIAISREELGLKPRKCFLCNQDAKICGRSRAHSVEELFEFTNEKLKSYVLQRSHAHRRPA